MQHSTPGSMFELASKEIVKRTNERNVMNIFLNIPYFHQFRELLNVTNANRNSIHQKSLSSHIKQPS